MDTSQSDKWNVIKTPWFYSALILFIVHQILQWGLRISIPFADNYLDPFLFLPIVLGAYLQERRLFLKNESFTLDNFQLIGISIILCVVVEVVFPLINTEYTFDLFDFVAYGLGGLYFKCKINSKFIVES